MVRSLLLRGMLAGLLAGILAFGFGWLLGEPQVDRAIAFEEQHAPAEPLPAHDAMPGMAHDTAMAAHDHGEVELVSRGVQSTLGLLTGVLVYGVALGGLFALVFAFAYGRVALPGARALSACLALAGFVAVVLVPALKYPPNPPAVGDPGTIAYRTQLFFLMLGLSLSGLAFAGSLRAQLAERLGAWNGTLAAGGVYGAVVILAVAVLPAVNEVPADFPADLLWSFRLGSLGIQLVLWTVIGIVFGAFAERCLEPRRFGTVLRPA